MSVRHAAMAVALLFGSSAAALSADYAPPANEGIDVIFELGAGARLEPAYEGADDYTVSPFPIFDVEYLNLPGLFDLGSPAADGTGLTFGPAFNYIEKRNSGAQDDLNGLGDVNATYEIGLRAGYEWEWAEIWGEARYAFGGGDGFVGEIGANLILRPSEELRFKIGPYASLADGGWMEDYFNVSAFESANSGGKFAVYDADGGFKGVGVLAETRWEFSPDWFATLDASYTRLVGDAADSPIVEEGSAGQFTVGLGLSRRFQADVF